jgi:hypothetical protein
LFVTELAGLGVPGLYLEFGDHRCGVYLDNAARDRLLPAFLRAGLGGGEKCVRSVDEGAHAGVLGDLARDATAAATHQLELTEPDDTYVSTDRLSMKKHPKLILGVLEHPRRLMAHEFLASRE